MEDKLGEYKDKVEETSEDLKARYRARDVDSKVKEKTEELRINTRETYEKAKSEGSDKLSDLRESLSDFGEDV